MQEKKRRKRECQQGAPVPRKHRRDSGPAGPAPQDRIALEHSDGVKRIMSFG